MQAVTPLPAKKLKHETHDGFGAMYLSFYLNAGWVPHDLGNLGESAQRVLPGEWPHVDFDETYSGVMPFLQALIFKEFGEKFSYVREFHFLATLVGLYRTELRGESILLRENFRILQVF